MISIDLKTGIRGAVYIPSRAYNAWQMWKNIDIGELRRDMGYATTLNLNAIRIWLSYEYWLEAAADFERKLDEFLGVTDDMSIAVMPSLFENCGVSFTPQGAAETNPFRGFAVFSPGNEIVDDRKTWESPRRFIRWFMDRFGSDERLVAIEVMNEPHFTKNTMTFATDMLRSAVQSRGRVPISMGSLGRSVYHNLPFALGGIEIFQYHLNFPASYEEFEKEIVHAKLMEDILGYTVWITEWQRIRTGGNGWQSALSGRDWEPAYATLASAIHKHRIGSFFWSLMVKPAYLPAQRPKGTLNGVFHEDGSVYSLEDARAIANDPGLELTEKREWPEWCRIVGEKAGVI